jgi:hypothetical protein
MTTLEFIVWQFVRVMVHLEEHGAKGAGSLYADWRSTWEKLDKRLESLAASDPDAFARLMMAEKVVIDCRSPAHLRDAIAAAKAVAKQLRAAVRSGADPDHSQDLEFEAEGMAALASGFEAILKATEGNTVNTKAGQEKQPRGRPRKGGRRAGGSRADGGRRRD